MCRMRTNWRIAAANGSGWNTSWPGSVAKWSRSRATRRRASGAAPHGAARRTQLGRMAISQGQERPLLLLVEADGCVGLAEVEALFQVASHGFGVPAGSEEISACTALTYSCGSLSVVSRSRGSGCSALNFRN